MRDLLRIGRKHPEIREFDVYDEALPDKLRGIAKDIETAASSRRLEAWRLKMEEDDAALFRYVKGGGVQPPTSAEPPQHPQTKLNCVDPGPGS